MVKVRDDGGDLVSRASLNFEVEAEHCSHGGSSRIHTSNIIATRRRKFDGVACIPRSQVAIRSNELPISRWSNG